MPEIEGNQCYKKEIRHRILASLTRMVYKET